MDQQTIADYPVGGAATTPTFRYVYASYIDEPVVRKTAGTGGTLVYIHRNHQYSVTAVTTSAGSIAERYAYPAYGQPTVLDAAGTILQTSNFSLRYSFTGREWDATLGLHHFRARWMSPSAGRFLGRDPIGYADGNSPYRTYFVPEQTDPNGKTVCKCRTSQWSSGGGEGAIFSHSTDYRISGGACSLLDSSTGGPYFGTRTSCAPYTGPLAGICTNRGTCCNVPNCENRLAEILNIIEHTPDPSILRNSTIASWLGIDAHCVTWTNSFCERENCLPAIPDTCINGPRNIVIDVPIPGGPEHSILILTSCDCSGRNCECFGIDNGFIGGD
jgi:RHS repeat-associated protein